MLIFLWKDENKKYTYFDGTEGMYFILSGNTFNYVYLFVISPVDLPY